MLHFILSKLKIKKSKKFFLIDSKKSFKFFKNTIDTQHELAIDTEFNWRNTYYPELSIIQIADRNNIFLIDCLIFKDLKFIKFLLENSKLLIFHSIRSDSTVLFSYSGIKIDRVFDVQIAEKKISDGENLNYASIVSKYFPVKLKKSETNSNWLKRPLSQSQVEYASDDVKYLIEIYRKQKNKLLSMNCYEKVLANSKLEANLGSKELYISRLSKLKNSSKIEKKIFMWREKIAMKKNVPSSYILKNNLLKKIYKVFLEEDYEKNLKKILKDDDLYLSLIHSINK